VGVHCGIYKSFMMSQIYHTWIHPLHHSPLPPHLHSWNSFSIFIHVYIVFTLYSPSHTLSHLIPPSHQYQPSQAGPVLPSCSLILWTFLKWHLYLFKIATQGVCLWHFHAYIYYNLNWFISVFLLSTLVPFLMVVSML
jgi:hypothetical protein